MNRVAANMDSATEARRQYVYQQKVKARLIRTNGQVARQEDHEYTATPQAEHTVKQLVFFNGEYHKSKVRTVRRMLLKNLSHFTSAEFNAGRKSV